MLDKPVQFDSFNLGSLEERARYKIFTGAIIPRPIALVSTLNKDGSVNLAPFSSFMIASAEAGYLAFTIGPQAGGAQNTLRNIRRSREFVINTVPEHFANDVQVWGTEHPKPIDKHELAPFETIASQTIKTPRVATTKVQFECRLKRLSKLDESFMVVGEVLQLHIEAGLLESGRIDPLKYAPLGRIAGRNYCTIREIIAV